MVNTLIGVNFSTFGVKSQTRMHLHVLISCKGLRNHGWWWVAVTDFNSTQKGKKKEKEKRKKKIQQSFWMVFCFLVWN